MEINSLQCVSVRAGSGFRLARSLVKINSLKYASVRAENGFRPV